MMGYAEKTPIFAVCGYDDADNYDTAHWLFLYGGCAMPLSIFPAAAGNSGPSAWCTRRLRRCGGSSDEAVADPGVAFGRNEAAGEGSA